MGILRTREEYLPITCAILKPEDRESFFASIKKQPGSRPEQIARLCEVTADVVHDWAQGKANMPYHTLQMLAHQFQAPMPAVGELRREYVAVAQVATRREAPSPPPRGGRKAEKAAKAERRERPQPKASKSQGRQQAKRREPGAKRPGRQTVEPASRRGGAAKPRKAKETPRPKGPTVPGPSEQLAYWVGIAIMATRREADALVMSADRRMGQNFAGSWANLSRDLFGVKPALQMLSGGTVQEARLPAGSLADFLDRLELKSGRDPGDAPVPRWAWSNPAWKAACLKGIVDACAHFQRAPALVLHGLPPRLAMSVEKMLASLGFKPEVAPDGTVTLRGSEDVDRYLATVGTSNMKLRDQFKAYQQPRRRSGQPGENIEADNEEGRERVLAEEVEAADEETEASNEQLAKAALDATANPEEDLQAAREPAAAVAPSTAPPRAAPSGIPRRRRTVFRGRPKR